MLTASPDETTNRIAQNWWPPIGWLPEHRIDDETVLALQHRPSSGGLQTATVRTRVSP